MEKRPRLKASYHRLERPGIELRTPGYKASGLHIWLFHLIVVPGCVAQLVACLATDASLTADPGVAKRLWGEWYWGETTSVWGRND